MFTPEKGEKCSCGFNHMSQKQRDLLFDEASESLAYIIRDNLHNEIQQDRAKVLATLAIRFGMFTMKDTMLTPDGLAYIAAALLAVGAAEET